MSASFYILRHKQRLLLWQLSARHQLIAHWRMLLHVAIPASFTNMLNPLASALLMTIFAGLGHEVVAAFGAAPRIETLLLIVTMALGSVLAPFVSQNYGAGYPARANSALLRAMGFSLLFQLAVYGMIWLSAPLIARQFSQEPRIIALIVYYLRLVPLGYGLQGAAILLASALNGAKASKISLLLNLIRLFAFILPSAWVGAKLGAEQGVFWGILIANVSFGLFAWTYAYYRFPLLFRKT